VEMVTAVRAIEALVVVTVLSLLAASSKNKPGYRRQWCAVVGAGTGHSHFDLPKSAVDFMR